MKKLMTCASIRLVFGFWLIVSFFVFGNKPAVKAEEVPISNLDGSTYIDKWEVPQIKGENLLEIRGNTLVDRKRYTWVAPEIADSVANGTEGFRKQIVGTWSELSRMQIIGREAQLHKVLYNGTHIDTIYTISKDGNSITTDQGEIFHRVPSLPPYVSSADNTAVSKPISKVSPAVAQIESRGEFYFLTKDGRRLTGEEANKVPLEEGSKIVTGKDGHIKMTLPDNTTFTVGPNSDVVIDEFVYDPNNSPKKVIASMTKGVFRWVTGKTVGSRAVYNDPEQMKVNLPTVAVGIRGTDFEASVQPDGSGSIVLNFGQLDITEKKTGFTFIMNAGEKITFGADGSVSRPMKIQ